MSHRAGLNRDRVVDAAAELVNAEGVQNLTLSRLAARLGVQTPSLYNHVDGLPGLYRALAVKNARALAERLGSATVGKAGPQALMALAQAYRDFIKQAPGVYMASLRASGNQEAVDPALQAAEQRTVQVVLAVVASFGLTGEDGVHAVRGLRSVVHGFATLEIAGGFGLPLDRDESFRRLIDLFIQGLQVTARNEVDP